MTCSTVSRRDVDGYAKALAYFDEKLRKSGTHMEPEDILKLITADLRLRSRLYERRYGSWETHRFSCTEHRWLAIAEPGLLSDIGATVLDYFGIRLENSVVKADI